MSDRLHITIPDRLADRLRGRAKALGQPVEEVALELLRQAAERYDIRPTQEGDSSRDEARSNRRQEAARRLIEREGTVEVRGNLDQEIQAMRRDDPNRL
jgi:hypothetical protein